MENIKFERLKKDDCKELVDFLNRIFSAHNGKKMDFEKRYPRIFKPEDENMSWHLGAKANGNLCGIAASYPLKLRVGGRELNVSAGGNIAVDENVRGQGVMGSLLTRLDKENRAHNFDICYLHGDRFRYGNYGYELCGIEYVFYISASMLRNKQLRHNLSYADIRQQDEVFLKRVFAFYNTQKTYLVRDFKGFLDALTAKEKIPVAILSEDKNVIGYFCIDDQNAISEIHISNSALFAEVMKTYMEKNGIKNLSISLPAFSPLFMPALHYCSGYRIIQPANFKILNFKNVVESFMHEKCRYDYLPDGSLTIDSDVFGTWEIKKEGAEISVNPFNGKADIHLEGIDVYQFIFGPCPPLCKSENKSSLLAKAWFPLPLFCPYLT